MSGTLRQAIPGVPPFFDDPRAECRKHDGDLFFPIRYGPNSADVAAAKAICRSCKLRDECETWATRTEQPYGVWAGTTPNERARRRATTPLPGLPPRAQKPFGWQSGRPTGKLALLFEAAEVYEQGGHTLAEVADLFDVNRTSLAHAVKIREHAPDIADDVVAGWYSFKDAHEYANAVGKATASMGEAA